MTRVGEWTELQNTRASSTLVLAADYSEGGVGASVAAYAIAATDRSAEKRVKRAIEVSVRRALPGVVEIPEIHMKQIWSGQQRQKTAFQGLSFTQVRDFLRDLARNFSIAVPLSGVAVQAIQPLESRLYRGPNLYGAALQLVSDCLARDHIRVGSSPILVDRGDPFQIVHHMEGDGIAFGPLREQLPDGQVFCKPSPRYVDSASSPLVQAADFCAFVVIRLIGELQKLLADSTGGSAEAYDFFLELVNLMRMDIDIALPTDHRRYTPAPWEVRTVGDVLPAMAKHIDATASGRVTIAAPLHQAAHRTFGRHSLQELQPWPRVSTCHGKN